MCHYHVVMQMSHIFDTTFETYLKPAICQLYLGSPQLIISDYHLCQHPILWTSTLKNSIKMTYSLCGNAMKKGVHTYSSVTDAGLSARSVLCPPSAFEAKSFWDAALARSPPWSLTSDKVLEPKVLTRASKHNRQTRVGFVWLGRLSQGSVQ